MRLRRLGRQFSYLVNPDIEVLAVVPVRLSRIAAKRFEQLSCATYRRLANRFGATGNFLSERS
ncbi:hypothetical protein FEP50_05915 [Burkholderia multivorans]|nr:hypothetical protein [Burkholderia multivorans]MDR8806094.1 hypothetical protein [Burkholderia multivorans]MDR9090150.1 hypothetical protein [Burkholderia multivorans]MDR9114012.1 hypothetical protein [Burkholderia multivorans]